MRSGAEGLAKMSRAILTNQDQPVSEITFADTTYAIKAFPNRLGHSFRHAFAGYFGKLAGELMGLFLLDVKAHFLPSTIWMVEFYHSKRINATKTAVSN